MPLDGGLIAVLCGLGLVLLMVIANAVITSRQGEPNRLMTRLIYGVGALTVLMNIVRMIASASYTMVFANALALICILVVWMRSEKPPAADKDEE